MKLIKKKNDEMIDDIKNMESKLELVKKIKNNTKSFINLKNSQIKTKIDKIKNNQDVNHQTSIKLVNFKIKSGKSPFLSNKLPFILRNSLETINYDLNSLDNYFNKYICKETEQFDQILEQSNLIKKKEEFIKNDICDIDSLKNAPIEKLNQLYITAKSQNLLSSILHNQSKSKEIGTYTSQELENIQNKNQKLEKPHKSEFQDWKNGFYIFGGKGKIKENSHIEKLNNKQPISLTACSKCLNVLNTKESLSYLLKDFCSPNCIYDYDIETSASDNRIIDIENHIENSETNVVEFFNTENNEIDLSFDFESL